VTGGREGVSDALRQVTTRGASSALIEDRKIDRNNLEETLKMNSRKMSSVALAAAAAVMFSTAMVGTASAADEAKVKCEGVNSCKGHSACKSANNSCKGQNSCKGKGFVEMTQAKCDAAKAKAAGK
jgi:hypothetical protein